MAIFSRMLRLFKADVHGVMDQLEDKGLLLKQYLREMETALEEKETRLAAMQQALRQSGIDLARRNEEIEKLENDLELAVRKAKDDIARMLIRKRCILQTSCEQLTRHIASLTETHDSLSETLAQQRLQYDQLKLKIAAFNQQAQPDGLAAIVAEADASQGWKAPTDEEIELELLRRKETLQQGGAA